MWIAKNYIDGEFVDSASDSFFHNTNPCDGGSLGTFFNSRNDEVDGAYAVAREALAEWRSKSRVQRAEYLYRVAQLIEERREDLARIVSLETG